MKNTDEVFQKVSDLMKLSDRFTFSEKGDGYMDFITNDGNFVIEMHVRDLRPYKIT